MSRHHADASVPASGGQRPPGWASALLTILRAWPRLWMLVGAVVVGFLVLGGDSLASSSRAVLHGLCAQRPSHSFTVGGETLPFDARMTGIYTGALWTWLALVLRRRLLAAGTPAWRVVSVLAAAVGTLAVDGFNALAVDLGVWHPYEPMNAVRFFTGFGTGVALVSLEIWLIGGALWKLASSRPAWVSLRSLWWVPVAATTTFSLISIDLAWTYPFVTAALLASAWVTVTGLMLVIVVSVFRVDRWVMAVPKLEVPLIASAVAGLLVIIALAQVRFWLERSLGIPQDFEPVALVHLRSILATI